GRLRQGPRCADRESRRGAEGGAGQEDVDVATALRKCSTLSTLSTFSTLSTDALHHMAPELRLAIRRLAREPLVAIGAIATLALGIGTCTAMFSIVQAVLLKSMGVTQPQRLVVMWPQIGDTPGEFAYSDYV